MKLTFAISALLFSIVAMAQQQEDGPRQQPPVITHSEVIQDARMAQLERSKTEQQKPERQIPAKNDKAKKENNDTVSENNTSPGKTSSKPEKQ